MITVFTLIGVGIWIGSHIDATCTVDIEYVESIMEKVYNREGIGHSFANRDITIGRFIELYYVYGMKSSGASTAMADALLSKMCVRTAKPFNWSFFNEVFEGGVEMNHTNGTIERGKSEGMDRLFG